MSRAASQEDPISERMTQADPKLRAGDRDPVPPPLKRFIWDVQSIVELAESEREILLIGRDLMARLIAADDWLPTVFAAASEAGSRQFQIYRDGLERFSIVSTILPGGTALAITKPSVWEILGVLAGAVARQPLDGGPDGGVQANGNGHVLPAGTLEAHGSRSGDLVRLSNGLDDRASLILHVYGGDIGKLIGHPLAPDGRMLEPLAYANAESAPPYDIFSIQTEIRD
ncbi:MAG TPA: hypothetical protein VME69_09195 [Methylocella sp.]|nr:hypothetical protein [Methylocella sp.]